MSTVKTNSKLSRQEGIELSKCLEIITETKQKKWHSHGRSRTIQFIDRIFTKEMVRLWKDKSLISFDILNQAYRKLTGTDHQNYKVITSMSLYNS